VQRNQHAVGGNERVEREQSERRRRVDDDEIELRFERFEKCAQPTLAIGE